MNFRYLLFPGLIYGVPNALAFCIFFYFGIILVDTIPVVVTLSSEMMAVVFVVFFGSFGFIFFASYKCANWFNIDACSRVPYLIGLFVLLVQGLTFFVAVNYDFGRVGAKDVQSNGFVLLASYVKADFVFMVYYGHIRGSRVPWFNLGLYIVSNVVRGWSSVWMVVALVEIYCFIRKNNYKIPYAKLSVFFLAAALVFPWLNSLKENIRGGEGNSGYVDSYFKLFNRLQHISNVVLIAQEASSISNAVSSGSVLPWYMFNTFLANAAGFKGDPLQKYITKEYLLDRGDGVQYGDEYSWYTHIGVAGWLFVLEWFEWPFYVVLVFCLLIFPYKFATIYIRSYSVVPVLHVASFVYVLHGWMDVQMQFISALMGYVVIIKLVGIINLYLLPLGKVKA
jgi:hypothetical protein